MQNVNINQEVENAMMAPPQQPRGIVDLLASELKARDAKARNQLNTMMAPAPDSNTIISQNEKETENNVRQEIAQKMQARVMQEKQAQARQKQALAGIAGQRANNMARMANGGIIGYAEGGPTPGAVPKSAIPVGNSNQPIPMLMQKYGSEKVLGYLKERKALDAKAKAIAEAGTAAGSMQVQDLRNMKEIFSEKYRDIISESMGMAGGGIIGFQDGGRIKRFQGLEGSEVEGSGGLHPFSFVNWVAGKGIDLAVLGAQEVAALAEEFSNTEVGQNQRNVLGEVASGAVQKLQDMLPIPEVDPNASKFPEMDANIQRGRDERRRKAERNGLASLTPELADMGGAPGAGGAPQARRGPSEAGLADAQAEMDILNAAQRRQDEAEQATREPQPYILSDLAKGAGLEDFFSGVPSLEELYPALPEDSSGAYRVGRGINAALTTIPKVLSGFLQPERGMTFADVAPMAQDLGRGILGDEQGTRTPTEAEEIIASGPSTTPAEPAYDPMKGVEAVADPNLRRAIEGAQAAPATDIAAPAAEQDGEVAATQLASTVASNPTPQNMSRFESEIQRLMEKRESPVRALSSFLKSFSQARGGSMGQNLAIATTAMNAADDAMDKQIIALEQLRRADQISERDFGLKQEQLTSQKGLLDAQASYYKNYKDMQVEIAKLKEAGDTTLANRKLYQSILDLAAANRPAYLMAAKAELGATDMFSPEVTERADAMMKQTIQTEYSDAQRFFGLPETDGAGLGADVRSELETYIGQQ